MAGEWRRHEVRDLLSEGKLAIGDGYRAKNEELVSSGLPFARAGNINEGFRFDDADHFPEENLARVGNKISQPGDVVFTSKGTVGRFAFVRPDTMRFVYSPQLCFWRSLDQKEIAPRFLYYWMYGREFFVQFKGVAGQTDMAEYVSLTDQRRMHITLPGAGEQRAIAHILGTLDDKIELNRRMNETLEAMAQALFKSWFVDFDPVRAKAEGRQPVRMDVETVALFPDAFEDSTLGKRPKGWYVGPLGGILELKRGYDLPQQRRIFGFIPIYSSSGLTGYHSEAKVKGPGIVTGRYGTIGEIFFVNEDFWPLNTTLYVRNFKNNIPRFVYYHLHTLSFEAYLDKAAVPGINRNHVHQEIVLCPPVNLQCKFVERLEPFWQRQAMNNKEARTLATLRDTLLPKLISGELRVKDAERFIGRTL